MRARKVTFPAGRAAHGTGRSGPRIGRRTWQGRQARGELRPVQDLQEDLLRAAQRTGETVTGGEAAGPAIGAEALDERLTRFDPLHHRTDGEVVQQAGQCGAAARTALGAHRPDAARSCTIFCSWLRGTPMPAESSSVDCRRAGFSPSVRRIRSAMSAEASRRIHALPARQSGRNGFAVVMTAALRAMRPLGPRAGTRSAAACSAPRLRSARGRPAPGWAPGRGQIPTCGRNILRQPGRRGL